MRFQTRVEGKPSRVRLTDGEERAVTETYRTIAPRWSRPTRWNVFLPISMPIVSTRVALIDVAWDILLVLLISQREVYASPGRSAAIGLGVPPNA